jgi:YkoY family integral membrane protein
MTEILSQILGNDWESALIIILNLIIIESLLSVDNAAVLATMVMDLPQHQRAKALRYGIIGAYVFRGLCLIFAAWLINIWWLKPLGGLYLLYLAYDYFRREQTPQQEDDLLVKEQKWFYKISYGLLGQFWATVVAVEIMDLAFSLDNVFAAVAFTDNIWLVCIGVFIGILAMRFVAQWFVRLLERYPFLETSAFLVIGILGIKLFLSLPTHFNEGAWWAKMLDGETADLIVSILTAGFFFVPIITSRFLGWPKRATTTDDSTAGPVNDAIQAPRPVVHPNGTNKISEKEAVSALVETTRLNAFPQPGPLPRQVVRTSIYSENRYLAPLFLYERR